MRSRDEKYEHILTRGAFDAIRFPAGEGITQMLSRRASNAGRERFSPIGHAMFSQGGADTAAARASTTAARHVHCLRSRRRCALIDCMRVARRVTAVGKMPARRQRRSRSGRHAAGTHIRAPAQLIRHFHVPLMIHSLPGYLPSRRQHCLPVVPFMASSHYLRRHLRHTLSFNIIHYTMTERET